jgi:hypothetical protein
VEADVRRFVYSPKVYAFVRTEWAPKGFDISDYIVRGNVHRVQNAASTAEIELRNPDKMFTHPGNPTFRPMDPITIFLTRVKDRPVQVFTGYLDTTPYIQLFPGTVTLKATCTLKRLLHTFWDPSLPYVFDGFLREYGWNLNPKTGEMFSEALYDGPTLSASSRALNDGSFGQLLFGVMKEIGGWTDDTIYIEKLPDGKNGSADIVEKVTAIYNSIAKDNEPIKGSIETLLRGLIGTGSAGAGGGPLGDVGTAEGGPKKFQTAANKWGKKLGVPPHILMGIAEVETGFGANNGPSSAGARGYMQFMPQTRAFYLKKYGVDAWGSIDEAVHAAALYLRAAGIASDVRKAIYAYNHAEWYVDDVLKAAEKYKGAEDDDQTGGPPIDNTSEKDAKDNSRAKGAAPKDGTTDPDKESESADEDRDKLLDASKLKGRFGSGLAALDGAGKGLLPIARLAQIMSDGQIDVSAGRIHHDPGTQHELGLALDLAIAGVSSPEPKKDALYKVIQRLVPICKQIIYRNTAYFDGQKQAYGATDHMDHIHVSIYPKYKDDPEGVAAAVVKAMNGEKLGDVGTGDSDGPATGSGDSTNASAFAAYLNLPGVFDVAEAIGLAGQKSLLNDQPLFPFVQQLAQGSLRNFQSMPNGNFYAFFPDYFGGFGHRTPYWLIDDIEILDGRIDLTDEFLATHVYIVGDINFDQRIDLLDRLQSGGVMDLESAFKSGFIKLADTQASGDSSAGLGVEEVMNRENVLKFLQRYGARPYKEELPMIRSPFFEAFLAYQKFMQLWAKQFSTQFQFTFMPELYPGGIVGLPDHGIQLYVEEVIHTFDYESGFTTEAMLSSPAAMTHAAAGPDNISAGMVRGFDAATTESQKKLSK